MRQDRIRKRGRELQLTATSFFILEKLAESASPMNRYDLGKLLGRPYSRIHNATKQLLKGGAIEISSQRSRHGKLQNVFFSPTKLGLFLAIDFFLFYMDTWNN